jgi:hypothetical protein
MKSKPPPSTITAQLHTFPGGSGVANLIALLTEENEKLGRLAALLTSQLELMRAKAKRPNSAENANKTRHFLN